MGALFGALSALSIGLGDLFGRQVSERRGPNIAAMVMQAVATVAALVTVFVISSTFTWRDIGIGAVSGIGLGTGLAFYLGGLTRSSSAVVAPVVATLSAVIPFGYALGRGASTSAWAVAGAAVAIAGLILITAGGSAAANVAAGLRWALVSGLGYGFGLSISIEASEASGAWPAVSQRLVAFALMLVVVMRVRGHVPLVGVRAVGIAAGTFGALSTVFFLLGVQRDATPAVVMASMFPAVSVTVGKFMYGDSVNRAQLAGLGVVLVGITAVVAG